MYLNLSAFNCVVKLSSQEFCESCSSISPVIHLVTSEATILRAEIRKAVWRSSKRKSLSISLRNLHDDVDIRVDIHTTLWPSKFLQSCGISLKLCHVSYYCDTTSLHALTSMCVDHNSKADRRTLDCSWV